MARTSRNIHETGGMGATPSLIRWGAVFGGAVIGMSLLVLLSVLWIALGFGTEVAAVSENLVWFIAGSAILSMFVGGLLAGWLSGVPGAGPGFFNGATVWGLILIAGLAIGPAATLQVAGVGPATLGAEQALGQLALGDALWASFLSLLVGALAAGLGGSLGGAITHPAFVYASPATETHRETESWTDERPPTDRRRADVEGATVDVRDDETEITPREQDTEPVGTGDRDGDRRT